MTTQQAHHDKKVRRAYYLSLEYLMGRLLINNLHNSGIYDEAKDALAALGQNFDDIANEEDDMGLGNGGLGSSCILLPRFARDARPPSHRLRDPLRVWSFPSRVPVMVIRSSIQIFGKRRAAHGRSCAPNFSQTIKLYGRVEHQMDENGNFHPTWVDYKTLEGMPFDVAIVGYGAETVNFLRLWSRRSTSEFDLNIFNEGGYVEAVREKAMGETISKVLYPNDATENGKELRLIQQYFFVSCSLQDIIRRFKAAYRLEGLS